MLHIWPHADPTRDTHNKGRCIIFHISVQEDVYIGVGSSRQVLRAPPLYYRYRPCRDWWKMQYMFTRVRYQCLEGIPFISGAVPDT